MKTISSMFELPMNLDDTLRDSFGIPDKLSHDIDKSKATVYQYTPYIRKAGGLAEQFNVYVDKHGVIQMIGYETVYDHGNGSDGL